jgi:class 3 adenylate cyclase
MLADVLRPALRWEDARDVRSEEPADCFVSSSGETPDDGVRGFEMTDRTARRLAWGAFALYALLFLAAVAFELATRRAPGEEGLNLGDLLFAISTAAFPIVAILILARQPRNPIGWILMAIGLGWVLGPESYGKFAVSRDLPGGALAIALSSPTWAPPIGLMGTVLLLRFPTGRLLSARWRVVEWLALFAIAVVTVAITLAPGTLADEGYPNLRNPLGIDSLKALLDALTAFLLLIPATIVASAVSLIIRFRRSSGMERVQLKALAVAAATVAVTYLAAMLLSLNWAWFGPDTPAWVTIIQNVTVASFVLIPIAIGLAILKHRLYDIEVIINRAVVFAIVVGFITAVYVGVVAGIGAVVGSGGGSSVALPIVATAIVGVAFQPLMVRARRVADRVVYGRRATPYEALASVAGPGSAAELCERVARLAVESTAARTAVVWLREGQELRPAAWWPGTADAPAPVRMSGPGSPVLPEERHVQPLVSAGDVLGAISVQPGRGETLTAADERLLSDLATQAAVALDRALSAIDLPEGSVTLVMTDVEGSTALWEEDPSAMAHALADHDAIIQETVSASEGLLLKSRGEGDSTFSVFVDAIPAMTAALAMQKALSRQRWPTPRPIRVRAAIHTGEVQVRDRDYYGSVPNRCARLRSIAHGEQTLLSKATRDAARDSLPPGAALLDLGAHRLKDLSAPEHVFQLCDTDLRMEFPPLRSLDAIPNNLPRRDLTEQAPELDLVRGLLGRSRLLTLVERDGSASVDLAVQAAADALDQFPGGVWYMEAGDWTSVSASLARAMDVTEGEVAEVLRDHRALVVLDARHRRDVAPEVAALLERYPDLRVIAASGAELGVAGETVFVLRGT